MGMLAGLVDSLSFTAPLHVKVAEPLLGAVHKGCQLLVFLYVGISLYIGDSWAYTEAPVGVVNAWPEGGDWRAHADLFPNVASLPHCTDDRFSYAYDENFVMDNPECLKLHPCTPAGLDPPTSDSPRISAALCLPIVLTQRSHDRERVP